MFKGISLLALALLVLAVVLGVIALLQYRAEPSMTKAEEEILAAARRELERPEKPEPSLERPPLFLNSRERALSSIRLAEEISRKVKERDQMMKKLAAISERRDRWRQQQRINVTITGGGALLCLTGAIVALIRGRRRNSVKPKDQDILQLR